MNDMWLLVAKTMNDTWLLVAYLIGIVIGIIINWMHSSYGGFLRIDRTNPEKDLYLVDLKIDLDELSKKKWIKFKVDSKANLSRGGSSNGRDE